MCQWHFYGIEGACIPLRFVLGHLLLFLWPVRRRCRKYRIASTRNPQNHNIIITIHHEYADYDNNKSDEQSEFSFEVSDWVNRTICCPYTDTRNISSALAFWHQPLVDTNANDTQRDLYKWTASSIFWFARSRHTRTNVVVAQWIRTHDNGQKPHASASTSATATATASTYYYVYSPGNFRAELKFIHHKFYRISFLASLL